MLHPCGTAPGHRQASALLRRGPRRLVEAVDVVGDVFAGCRFRKDRETHARVPVPPARLTGRAAWSQLAYRLRDPLRPRRWDVRGGRQRHHRRPVCGAQPGGEGEVIGDVVRAHGGGIAAQFEADVLGWDARADSAASTTNEPVNALSMSISRWWVVTSSGYKRQCAS
jgi:hypothetical protein